jgi:hypothetical protein
MAATMTMGRGMARRLGLLVLLVLLALGLLAAPAGAAAAEADSAHHYYDPVVYTSRAVVSGERIVVEGFNFYAHDTIYVQVFDAWGFERANGGTTTNWDGFFSGTITTFTMEPGFYTVVVSDTAGAILYMVVEVVY